MSIRYFRTILIGLSATLAALSLNAQINTEQVIRVGRNALYFEDYVLSIQYFNQAIAAKPYMAKPYFYRAVAKLNLDDYLGAEEDATLALERNPFITDAYELRGVARQNLGDNERAIADYDHVLHAMPQSRGVLFNKALALQELKRYDEADSTYTTLLRYYPKYDNGYMGRARLRLETTDTIGALADIDQTLQLNKNSVNAYILRADIAINRSRDYEQALADMDEAIKLEPRFAGLFINRAFLRHSLDDYYGAMSDYDYAIELDPLNAVALYNRSLLRAEVHDYDRAIADLNQVLAIKGIDYRTLYNRAIVYREKGALKEALADVNEVIEAYPSLAAGYFLRSDIKRAMGDLTAEEDYNHSLALARQTLQQVPQGEMLGEARDNALAASSTLVEDDDNPILTDHAESQEVVAARFTSLLTINNVTDLDQEYGNKSIRGRVQDRNMVIEVEPMFMVSYYYSPTELRPSTDFLKEIDELNRTRALRFVLQLTNREPQLTDDDEIRRHFESIEYYNSYISTHAPRAIDYFGRAMDFVTLRNYSNAIADFDRAIALAPDFTLAYFMRSLAKYMALQSERAGVGLDDEETAPRAVMGNPAMTPMTGQPKGPDHLLARSQIADVVDDLDKVIELSPDMAIAHYNKGVLMVEIGDLTSALSAFNRAIELKPTLGEAYYNRGYVFFKLGNRANGTADLSKAGELGVVPSYSLIKRMTR